MKGLVRCLAVIVSILSLQSDALLAQWDRITSPIDRNRTVVVSGNLHAQVQSQYDQGPAEPSFQIEYVALRLKHSSDQQAALDKLLAEQQDRSSANFHKWVTPEVVPSLTPNPVFGSALTAISIAAQRLRTGDAVKHYA